MTVAEEPKTRLHGLDELRGWAALSIVVYHFSGWGKIEYPQWLASPLDLMGYYGVSVFYVLSGCVLSIIYGQKIGKGVPVSRFYVKRYLRIAPLFIVVLVISTLGAKVVNPDFKFDLWRFFLNITLLFSWFAPDAYMPVGGWSIGNEMFFYSVFPLLLFFLESRKRVVIFIFSMAAITFAVSSFYVHPGQGEELQFSKYVNPLNHVSFFGFGMLIGRYGLSWEKHRSFWFLSSIIVFWILSMSFESRELVSGGFRIILLGVMVIWCWFALTAKQELRNRPMEWVGKISYSLYLVHPIVFLGADGVWTKILKLEERTLMQAILFMVTCFIVSLICAWMLWRLVEPFGGKFTRSRRVAPAI